MNSGMLGIFLALSVGAACGDDGDGGGGDAGPSPTDAADATMDAVPAASIQFATLECVPRNPQAAVVEWDVTATGTMMGPEGSESVVVINGGSAGPGPEDCGVWTLGTHDSPLDGVTCARQQDPESSTWVIGVYTSGSPSATFMLNGAVTLAGQLLDDACLEVNCALDGKTTGTCN